MADFAHRIPDCVLARRFFLALAGIATLGIPRLIDEALAMATDPTPSLLSASLELGGGWKSSPADAVLRVLSRMQEVSLAGVRLLSDQQPGRIRVDNHASGSPAIWLHDDHTNVAWIMVDIGTDDWCKLSYQFGHELGHVLCNSWNAQSQPHNPCQWLEETMVEAFSIRGLGCLAASWERNPPFAGDAAFGSAIREYRGNLLKNYGGAKVQISDAEFASWFRASRSVLERSALSGIEGQLIIRVVSELERDIACVEDLGALNRWPSRSGVPLEDYLRLWEKSCTEVHALGRLPVRLRSLLGVS
jgi:hypothetical protein